MNISSDNSDNNGNGGGLIALLDLPKHSRVGLDGQVIILQHEDFVGISNIPVAAATTFHLVTAAAAASNTSNNQNLGMTVGFVVFDTKNPVHLIRKYNPQTEEVSHETVDDITTNNLLQQVQQGTLPPTRLLPYSQIVTTPQNVNHHWTQTTRYICSSNILQLRNLHSGDKIVPGAYQEEEEQVGNDVTNTTTTASVQNDGKSISYPPIPVLDPTKELHIHKHAGTQRFLATLPPPERTQLFLWQDDDDRQEQDLPSTLVQHLLTHYYQNSYTSLLGDVQLSFTLFLQLQCLHSLNHWKDLVAMLSLASSHDCSHHMALYQGLLQVLSYQLSAMDMGFLEEDDEAGGNFLLPSLQRLQRNLSGNMDATVMDKFQNVLQSKFPQTFSSLEDSGLRIQLLPDGGEDIDDDDAMQDADNDIEHDNDNEDGPVMVSQDEIQAAMARSTYATPSNNNSNNTIDIPRDIQEKYPLLMAAMQPHEDVVMTCARALDEQVDVSLVREAAAYLEQVEQYR